MALGAAASWSLSVILFRRSEAISPLGLNLFKNTVGIGLLGLTLAVMGQGPDLHRSTEDWLRLGASGVLGIGVADTLILMALRRLGPSLLAVVDCIYAPVIVLMSVLFLGEHIGLGFAAGAALVVVGVLLATGEGAAAAGALVITAKDRAAGVAFGLTGIASMAIGVVLAKPPLERGSLPEVTLVRLVAGVCAQMLWIAFVRRDRTALLAFRPSKAWRNLVPAAVLSAYVALLLWLGGFKWASASVAAVLNQMSTVFTIALARIVLKEPVSGRRALGGAVAVAGAIVVLLR